MGLLALEVQLVGDLTAGQAAAHDDHILTHLCLAQQEVDGLDALLDALDGDGDGSGAGGHDDLVCLQFLDILDFSIQLDINGILGQLPAIPGDEIPVLPMKVTPFLEQSVFLTPNGP